MQKKKRVKKVITHKHAIDTFTNWVAKHVHEHLSAHKSGKDDHRLHFNLAKLEDVISTFEKEHPKCAVLIWRASGLERPESKVR